MCFILRFVRRNEQINTNVREESEVEITGFVLKEACKVMGELLQINLKVCTKPKKILFIARTVNLLWFCYKLLLHVTGSLNQNNTRCQHRSSP